MSNTTELERLNGLVNELIQKFEGETFDALCFVGTQIDAAIAAEKQRRCANCEHSEKSMQALYGWETCPMAYDILNRHRELNPQGYCHKFTPRKEAGDAV